ncbi:MAG: hypothetical protein LQ346_004275 [Caloplaca aetnensis]|nr:MAG: hypothetical protein LQ346_004275 [Caloplaca aetnensis]
MSSRPSQLAISTSSVQRLLKEESTYRAELASQESRLRKLEQETSDDDGNREWSVRQEKQAIAETKAVFAPLREKVLAAAANLEELLVS